MVIAVDYTLARKHIGGMGVFLRNIINELYKIDRENKYILINNPVKFDAQNTFTKIISVIKEQSWYQTKLLKELNLKNPDLFYSPNPPAPYLTKTPLIITIPDMAFYYEKSIPFLMKKYLLINYYLSAKKAKIITTFSKYSKKDIQKILKIKSSKIKVIPLAASTQFKPSISTPDIKNTLRQLNINKSYVLCTPGTFLPRKNVKDLIEAVFRLKTDLKNSLLIVLVGNNYGLYSDKLKDYIDQLKMNGQVIFTGYVKNRQLVHLFQSAKLFVYPSLYEGFGLPPLEAMSCGVPVIVYNKTSLPEVVGSAGLKVNNSKELTKAIEKVLRNKQLCNKLAKKGLKRSKTYNWERTAKMFKKVFEEASLS